MADEMRTRLAEEFLMFVGQIIRGMDCIFRHEMERYEVTWPQFHLLKMVKVQGTVTVTELSNVLMIAAPTASRMIDGLASKGLLEKEKDRADQRVTLIRLTEKSRSLLKDLLSLQNEVMAEVFRGEDTAELERTIRHLNVIGQRWFEMSEKRASERDGQ